MRTLHLVLAVAALALSTGCIIVDPVPGGSGCLTPGVLTSRIRPGAGAPDPGYAGVIITANVGGSYRITWANEASWFSKVEGVVTNESCAQPRFTPGCGDGSCALMGSDTVVIGTGPGEIAFQGFPFAGGGRSGFDIVIGDANRLEVDVRVNGSRNPSKVVFVSTDTNALASAATLPIALSTQ